MKRLAVVLTLVVALVFSTVGMASAGSAGKGKSKGATTTSGPFIPGGSWEFEP